MNLLPFAYQEDIEGFTDSARRKVVVTMMKVAKGQLFGEALVAGMYDLSDCRKLHLFDVRRNGGYRIVFRILDNTHVEIVAVGPRESSVVYHAAGERLNRPHLRPHFEP